MARATLSDERLQIRSPIRDRAIKERAEALEWGIKLIDKGFGIAPLGIVTLEHGRLGELMIAAGYEVDGPALRGPTGWQGSLPDVEARLKTPTRQRAEAQAALAVRCAATRSRRRRRPRRRGIAPLSARCA